MLGPPVNSRVSWQRPSPGVSPKDISVVAQMAAETWDAAMILVRALRALGMNATAEQAKADVSAPTSYDGPTGHFDFRYRKPTRSRREQRHHGALGSAADHLETDQRPGRRVAQVSSRQASP